MFMILIQDIQMKFYIQTQHTHKQRTIPHKPYCLQTKARGKTMCLKTFLVEN